MGELGYTQGFQPLHDGGAFLALSGFEREIVLTMASQLIELLRSEEASEHADEFEALMDFNGPVEAPHDPVLNRLFPTAYPDDDEAAAEFRRYTERSLRSRKAGHAGVIVDSLSDLTPVLKTKRLRKVEAYEVELNADELQSWLRGLTDIRLALAVRLGIETEETEAELLQSLPETDPRYAVLAIYHWLGGLQDSLVHTLG